MSYRQNVIVRHLQEPQLQTSYRRLCDLIKWTVLLFTGNQWRTYDVTRIVIFWLEFIGVNIKVNRIRSLLVQVIDTDQWHVTTDMSNWQWIRLPMTLGYFMPTDVAISRPSKGKRYEEIAWSQNITEPRDSRPDSDLQTAATGHWRSLPITWARRYIQRSTPLESIIRQNRK